MKKLFSFIFAILIILTVISACGKSDNNTITGSGASFPYPVYSQWAFLYKDAKVNYQSIGSGAGISQVENGLVDFGASDVPLEKGELDEFNLEQHPILAGGIVLAYNLEGIDNINIDRKTLLEIFFGRITKWDDMAIKMTNPNVDLPDRYITVVRRADGSGTTWTFTKYLSEMSGEWANNVGCGKSVSWPIGVGSKGNEGVAANIQHLQGTIGYVEYAYAVQNDLSMITLENSQGMFVKPSLESFLVASRGAQVEKGHISLVNSSNPDSWPIVGLTYILIKKDSPKRQDVLNFFKWGISEQKDVAKDLGYIIFASTVFI